MCIRTRTVGLLIAASSLSLSAIACGGGGSDEATAGTGNNGAGGNGGSGRASVDGDASLNEDASVDGDGGAAGSEAGADGGSGGSSGTDGGNACDADLTSDVLNCGACGHACPGGANGTPRCYGGQCFLACDTGFGDCNDDTADGCEIDTNINTQHCGACSNACSGGRLCVSGACVADKCHVPPDDSAENAPACTDAPKPPDSFTPKTKWTWDDPMISSQFPGSIVIPLVGNFTDDDGNGEIDLCDVPDVLVTTWSGKIYMLAGDTGRLETTFDGDVAGAVTPAFGDIDGDGKPEVVTIDPQRHIVIYDENGHVQNVGTALVTGTTAAIYDLDADGTPEIIFGNGVFDNQGRLKFSIGEPAGLTSTAADLDGDGKLEVITGNAAYRANGDRIWSIPVASCPTCSGWYIGEPAVANLDDDPDPEILVAREDGLLVLEHDGRVKWGPIRPFNEAPSFNCWNKPTAIHDFDGDGIADIAASSCYRYGVVKVQANGATLNWSVPIQDPSGGASSTAFDFLGRGVANAVYGDQVSLLVLDGKTGAQNLKAARSSGTVIEYPVVADVDNDGSADIVVVSNNNGGGNYVHTVEVLQDAERRWVPTRRIWNQHAYHVTNVREDGTIPRVPAKSWLKLNTFRTNAQIQPGGECAPPAAR